MELSNRFMWDNVLRWLLVLPYVALSTFAFAQAPYINLQHIDSLDKQGKRAEILALVDRQIQLGDRAFVTMVLKGYAELQLLRTKQAIITLESAIKNGGGSSQFLGRAWMHLGTAYRQVGRYEDAVRALEESIKILPNDLLILLRLWEALSFTGNYERILAVRQNVSKLDSKQAEAFELILGNEETAKIAQRIRFPSVESVQRAQAPSLDSTALANIFDTEITQAFQWIESGDLGKAQLLLEQTHAAAKNKSGYASPAILRLEDALLAAYAARFDAPKILDANDTSRSFDNYAVLVSELVDRLRNKFGVNDRRVVGIELVKLYLPMEGRSQIQSIEQMLSLRDRAATAYGPESEEMLWANLIASYQISKAGQPDDALILARNTLKIAQARYRDNHLLIPVSNGVIGSVLADQNKYADAAVQLETALAGYKRLLADGHRATVQIAMHASIAFIGAGDFQRAQQIVDEILPVVDKHYGPNSFEYNMLVITQCLNLMRLGKYTDVVDKLVPIAKALADERGFRDEQTLGAYRVLGISLASGGNLSLATRLMHSFLPLLEEARSIRQYRGDNVSQDLLQLAPLYKHHAMTLALREPVEGFRVSELSKARSLLESSALSSAVRSGLLPAEEQKRLEELGAAIQYAETASRGTSDSTELRFKARQQLSAKQAELIQYQNQLKSKYPKFDAAAGVKIIGAPQGIDLLENDSIFLSFLSNNNDCMMYALAPANGLFFSYIPNCSEIETIVNAVREELDPSMGIDKQFDYQSSQLQKLSKVLLDPFKTLLEGKKKIIISPDGPLAFLPFEILPWKGGRPLIESFEVAYTPSLSVYALVKERLRTYKGIPRKSILALGGAIYTDTDQSISTSGKKSNEKRSGKTGFMSFLNRISGAGVRDESPEKKELSDAKRILTLTREPGQALRKMNLRLQNLPGTKEEVEAVGKLYALADTKLLVGKDASERMLNALNQTGELSKYRYLLFATHGYFNPEEPMLSAVIVNQIGNAGDEDGFITVRKWPKFDLKSDLIVLSACQTGVGRYLSGEGVIGLPYAMYVAGNAGVVSTLWPVVDQTTKTFMVSFFSRLEKGQAASSAMAQTKREFLANPRLTHPALWAGYVMYGE